jgi:flagellar hook assembly protein FlgD
LVDYDGNPRPKGEGYDIGAYEYQSPVGVFGDGKKSSIPKTPVLFQNYPNPCNPTTTIQYELPIRANTELIIYNALGQKVRTLVNEIQNAGSKSIDWNGTDNFDKVVDSGIYFYTLQVGNKRQTRKMLLIR